MNVGLFISAVVCLLASHFVESRGLQRGKDFAYTVRLLLGASIVCAVLSVIV